MGVGYVRNKACVRHNSYTQNLDNIRYMVQCRGMYVVEYIILGIRKFCMKTNYVFMTTGFHYIYLCSYFKLTPNVNNFFTSVVI